MPTITIQTAVTGASIGGGVPGALKPNGTGLEGVFVADVYQVSVEFAGGELPVFGPPDTGRIIYNDRGSQFPSSETDLTVRRLQASCPPAGYVAENGITLGDAWTAIYRRAGAGKRLPEFVFFSGTPGKSDMVLPTTDPTASQKALCIYDAGLDLYQINYKATDEASGGCPFGCIAIHDGYANNNMGISVPKFKVFAFFCNIDPSLTVNFFTKATVNTRITDLNEIVGSFDFGISDSTLNTMLNNGNTDALGVRLQFYTVLGINEADCFFCEPVMPPPGATYQVQARSEPSIERWQTFSALPHTQLQSGGTITRRLPCGHTTIEMERFSPSSPTQTQRLLWKHGRIPWWSRWCVESKTNGFLSADYGTVTHSEIGSPQPLADAYFRENPSLIDAYVTSYDVDSPVVLRAFYYDMNGTLLNVGGTLITHTQTDYGNGWSYARATMTPPSNAVRVRIVASGVIYFDYRATPGGPFLSSSVSGFYIAVKNMYDDQWGDLRYPTRYGAFLPGMNYFKAI